MPNVYNAMLYARTAEANTGQVMDSTPYDSFARMGVTVVVVTAAISLACVMSILTFLGVSFYKRRAAPSSHFFVRTHAAAYFSCLLVGDVLQAVATLMSIKWITSGGVTLNTFCSTQGAIKNAGNLSISLWTLMLAIHTFCALFLRWRPKDWVLYTTVVGVWLLVGFMVVIGPGAIQKSHKGPYYGISGYWCWISDPYSLERILFEYLWLLGSAAISFILYTLTFLRLRGNLYVENGKVRFCRTGNDTVWMYQAGRDTTDIQMTAVAKGMIGFPVLFTILVLPIAICRFIDWSGGSVSVQATIFSDAIFSLAGIFDLILFVSTRSLLPSQGLVPVWFYPRQKIPDEIKEHGVQPYDVKDFASAHGFNEIYQYTAERNMVTLPPRTSKSLTRPPSFPRPNRTISLTISPADLPIPPGRGQGGNRATMKTMTTRYSQDDNSFEYSDVTSPGAWDDVDLGQRTGDRSTFGNKLRPQQRDTQYTAFSLSAYQYARDSEVPPMPSGAGIPSSAGRTYDDDDDRSLIGGTQERSSFTSTESSRSYDLRSPEIKAPKPVARKF